MLKYFGIGHDLHVPFFFTGSQVVSPPRFTSPSGGGLFGSLGANAGQQVSSTSSSSSFLSSGTGFGAGPLFGSGPGLGSGLGSGVGGLGFSSPPQLGSVGSSGR